MRTLGHSNFLRLLALRVRVIKEQISGTDEATGTLSETQEMLQAIGRVAIHSSAIEVTVAHFGGTKSGPGNLHDVM